MGCPHIDKCGEKVSPSFFSLICMNDWYDCPFRPDFELKTPREWRDEEQKMP